MSSHNGTALPKPIELIVRKCWTLHGTFRRGPSATAWGPFAAITSPEVRRLVSDHLYDYDRILVYSYPSQWQTNMCVMGERDGLSFEISNDPGFDGEDVRILSESAFKHVRPWSWRQDASPAVLFLALACIFGAVGIFGYLANVKDLISIMSVVAPVSIVGSIYLFWVCRKEWASTLQALTEALKDLSAIPITT